MQQTPPHNADAELAVIGSAIIYGDRCLANASGLRSDEFYLPHHRDAWAAIRAAEAKPSGLVDVVTVGAEVNAAGVSARFEGGWPSWAMATAQKASLPEQISHHVAIVREMAATRKLIDVCVETMARCYSAAPFAECIETARSGVADLENAGGTSSTVHVREVIAELMDEQDRRQNGERIETTTTGIATLDETLDGLHPGQLVVVAARPGQGKTALACNVAAINALRGVPCLMFSLEMAARELAQRLIVWATKRNMHDVRNPDKVLAKIILEKASELCESKFWLNDRATKLEAIVSEARRWHAKHVRGAKQKRGIVFVDYAQLVTVQGQRGGNREQEVARISKTLKGLARYLEVPVFMLAQLNRAVETRGGAPMLSDLRESGAIEQDADIVIFPFRDIDPANQDERNKQGPAKLIVAKHRNGRIGHANVDWIPELMTFRATTETPPDWNDR